MKFIIEAGQTKRELPLPFAICSTPEDLEWLAERLVSTAEAMRRRGYVSGWMTIHDDVQGEPNSVPLAWDACGGPGYVVRSRDRATGS